MKFDESENSENSVRCMPSSQALGILLRPDQIDYLFSRIRPGVRNLLTYKNNMGGASSEHGHQMGGVSHW